MYRHHLKRAKRHYFSPHKLRLRIAFWGGALLIGVIGAAFALLGTFSDKHFYQLYIDHPWIAYALPPFGLALIAWLTRNFFTGTEGSGIPQATASDDHRAHCQRSLPPGLSGAGLRGAGANLPGKNRE